MRRTDRKSLQAKSRLAYSTEQLTARRRGGLVANSDGGSAREETVPSKVTAKLRIEKSGRGGKTVTVVYDLPRNRTFVTDLAKELKRACGSGGKAGADTVEIQGDHRDKLRQLLAAKGWTVKG